MGILAVVHLTSQGNPLDVDWKKYIYHAKQAGCAGIIMPPVVLDYYQGLDGFKRDLEHLTVVSPGVRIFEDADKDDHVFPSTPLGVLANGADMIVVGRPIYDDSHPENAIEDLHEEMK